MAELATLARPYAEALFRVAKNGNMSAWSAMVSEMSLVGGNPEVKALADNPNLSKQQVTDIVVDLLKISISDEIRNFIEVLVDNGRVTLLPEIGTQFHALKNADEGSANALIYSAFEMSDAQVAELLTSLQKKFGRKLIPTVILDQSLIGGVRVVVNDEVLDMSVRARLQQMHDALVS
jgi:F-type H+-transporting ATPase subunit delta